MDMSGIVGFDSMAHQIPPARQQTQIIEIVPMVTQVMPPQEQTMRSEEFRQFLIEMYTPNQSYSNCLLNIVANNGCNNNSFTEALTNYITFCTSLKRTYPNDYGRNGVLHRKLAKLSVYKCIDVDNQFDFWEKNLSNDQGLMQWINSEIADMRNDQAIATIKQVTEESLARRRGANMGFSGGMGSQSQQQPMNNNMVPNMNQNAAPQMQGHGNMVPNMNQNAAPQMQGHGSMTPNMNQNSAPQMHGRGNMAPNMNPNAINNNQGNMAPNLNQNAAPQMQGHGNTQQPAQQQIKPKAVQKVIKPVIKDGHRLSCEPNGPDYQTYLPGQLNIVGGWAINLKPTMFEADEFTEFKKYHWNTIYGQVTSESRFHPVTFREYEHALGTAEDLDVKELSDLLENEPLLDVDDPQSEGYDKYLELLTKQSERMQELRLEKNGGLFVGTKDTLTIGTKPWGLGSSILECAMEMFGETTLDIIKDSVHVTTLFGREFLLIDSSDPFVNGLVKTKRQQYGKSFYNADNIGAKGHYYLINYHLEDDTKPVIEDFYDGEYIMNPNQYKPAEPAKFQIDGDGDDLLDEIKVERTVVRDSKLSSVGLSPVEMAETIRTNAALNRNGEWGNAVLSGTVKTPSYFITVGKKDKALWAELQESIRERTISSLMQLGKWLNAKKEEGTLTLRMERIIDSRVTKELNIVFNDMLGFDGLIIEHSFMEEYEELIDLVTDEDTPKHVEAIYRKAEYLIMRKTLISTTLKGKDNEYLQKHFKATTPYEVVTKDKVDTIKIGTASPININETVNAIVTESLVYVLPNTMSELGINPHKNVLTAPWTILPAELLNEVKEQFNKPFNSTKVVIVTKDNYVLNVSGTNDPMLLGTLAINI